MHATDALAEADRLMTVCNSCRYCEGLCAVFPAMEMQRAFADADLIYLANLCHACGACYDDCQFAPPHAFAVNVPRTLAQVRNESYAAHAWPGFLFARRGGAIAGLAALSVGLFLAALLDQNPARIFFADKADFYALMPHTVMAATFGLALLAAVVAIVLGALSFRRASGAPADRETLAQAAREALSLTNLDGGGMGCAAPGRADPRKHAHHATVTGFALCLAATTVATFYHYVLNRPAPYLWYDPPVLLGTLGGLLLIAGPVQLLRARARRDPALLDPAGAGMEQAFTWMLLATAVSGLALLLLRATPAMGVLLSLHLGIVLALFLSLPYGKAIHGLYRFLALIRSARERRALGAGEA